MHIAEQHGSPKIHPHRLLGLELPALARCLLSRETLDEALVQAVDLAVDVDHQDSIRGGLERGPEERERAFDYAFRGTGAIASGRPGRGLGLAVSREILEANGGKISLTSDAGFGSEVTILLPFGKGGR